MSHEHHHHHASNNLGVAFFLNLTFTIIEIIGGLLTNSIAILSDALHDLGDTASLGLAWYFEKISKKKANAHHTYGYKRFRLLGGLVTGLVLVAGLTVVLWNAIQRIAAPEPVDAKGMMLLAILGIVVNGAAVLKMKTGASLTEKVISWHLLEDVLSWIAVLTGAGVMVIWDLPIIDPLLSIGISIFILWNVGKNLKQVIDVFLQTTPESFDLDQFVTKAQKIENVRSLHHTHSWSLDGESHVLSTHLVMDRISTRVDIFNAKKQIHNILHEHNFEHLTIEVELENEDCQLSSRHQNQ